MEEFVVLVVQCLLELIVEIIIYFPFELSVGRPRSSPGQPLGIWSRCFLWLLGGLLLSGASLLILDQTIITSEILRVLNFMIAPVLSAFIAEALAKRRMRRNPEVVPSDSFWQAFCFTFGLVLLRFLFAKH